MLLAIPVEMSRDKCVPHAVPQGNDSELARAGRIESIWGAESLPVWTGSQSHLDCGAKNAIYPSDL